MTLSARSALDADEARLSEELGQVSEALDAPGEDEVKAAVERVAGGFRLVDARTGAVIDSVAWMEAARVKVRTEHRRLVEAVFGRPVAGKPSGVYVVPRGERRPYRPQAWDFIVRGHLPFEESVTLG